MPVKFIMGVYPSAPSFHYLNEADEHAFFDALIDNEHIGGLEQPCLETFHPLGNDFLFKKIPSDWKIVITAVMYTMGRRAKEGGYGLASIDEDGRRAALKHLRRILAQIEEVSKTYGPDRFCALEIQSAPLKGSTDIQAAAEAFDKSLSEIKKMGFPCPIVIEHCDAMDGTGAVKKGFLPLKDEIVLAKEHQISLCINWARCVLEGPDHSPSRATDAIDECIKGGVMGALMFSGTSNGGCWGNFEDNHAPFAPFEGCRIDCPQSLMTVEEAHKCFALCQDQSLIFQGAKLLESDAKGSVKERADIILDGVDAILKACAGE